MNLTNSKLTTLAAKNSPVFFFSTEQKVNQQMLNYLYIFHQMLHYPAFYKPYIELPKSLNLLVTYLKF